MSILAKAMAKAGGGSFKTPTENVHELRTALASLADRSHPPDKVTTLFVSSSTRPLVGWGVPHGFDISLLWAQRPAELPQSASSPWGECDGDGVRRGEAHQGSEWM